ncbi:hypothetical protein EIN_129240 [Entamoeba invadens IP1]|uniref:PI3K/PI4K catalytic domain-containing protein n=1 Tax=Entamoeba invadens IP1 TaxID=370355 RepID=L7FN72_ENTIV|nr:hypothetical protein EIN_129240 [Entamoeba invadens IP1]ELP91584.1 hypothetical protein EIN_129240 [Entamoeba invadens IP1]|eukprot:XP_004258355.1 hypothetical protein EIN_129240 [Entamoeba invadens IP1]
MEEINKAKHNEKLLDFLDHVSMGDLEPDSLTSFLDANESGFIQFLPLIIFYITSQERGQYKNSLFNEITQCAQRNDRVLFRLMLLHKNVNCCFCCSEDFKKYSEKRVSSLGLKTSNSFECGLVSLISTLSDKSQKVEEMTTKLTQILLWFSSLYLSPDVLLVPPLELDISDYFFGKGKLIKICPVKRYTSTLRPIQLEFHFFDDKTQSVHKFNYLYKEGDDLRTDTAAQLSFTVFNAIWSSHTLFKSSEHAHIYPIAATYQVIPFNNSGLIEIRGNPDTFVNCETHKNSTACIDGRELEMLYGLHCETCASKVNISLWSLSKKEKIIETLAGGFVALKLTKRFVGGYIIGLRDRHLENMKFEIDNGTFFQIDFGYLLNRRPHFDANRFAVPNCVRNELKKFTVSIGEEMNGWDAFVKTSCEGFIVLRRKVGMILRIINLSFLFDQEFNEESVSDCIAKAFLLGKSEETAANSLIENLQSFSVQKMIKDRQHEILRWWRNAN